MSDLTKKVHFKIYRYNPDVDQAPYMKDYHIDVPADRDIMLLNALFSIKFKKFFKNNCRRSNIYSSHSEILTWK